VRMDGDGEKKEQQAEEGVLLCRQAAAGTSWRPLRTLHRAHCTECSAARRQAVQT